MKLPTNTEAIRGFAIGILTVYNEGVYPIIEKCHEFGVRVNLNNNDIELSIYYWIDKHDSEDYEIENITFTNETSCAQINDLIMAHCEIIERKIIKLLNV